MITEQVEDIQAQSPEIELSLLLLELSNAERIDDLFRDIEDLLETFQEHTIPEKRQEFARVVKLALYRSKIHLIETLYKEARQRSDGESAEVFGKARELRTTVERMKRRVQLLSPSSQREFEATLRWMAANGSEKDLDLLRFVQNLPPYSSDDINHLFATAEQHINQRIHSPYVALLSFFDLTPKEFARLTGLAEKRLFKHTSNHMEQIIQELREVKESIEALIKPDKINEWLHKPIPDLNGRTPHDVIAAGETSRVLAMLLALEEGVHN